jgi:hypothetical protein
MAVSLCVASSALGCSLFVPIPDLVGGQADVGTQDAAMPPPQEGGRGDSGSASSPYAQAVLADKPLAYWRLDELTGPTATDLSGHGYDGTYTGLISYGQPGAIANERDAAVSFNGGYMTAAGVPLFSGTAQFTLEVWIKRLQDDAYHGILAQNDRIGGNVSEGYLLVFQPANVGAPLDLSRFHASNGDYANTFGLAWSNTWTHVVATYDSQTITLYVNGVSAGSTTSTTMIGVVTDPFTVGIDSGGVENPSPFDGMIDEVAIYDHPLSLAQVQAHYTVGSGLPVP